MDRKALRTFSDVERYAHRRAERSVRRNDPVAAAYWLETAAFAGEFSSKIADDPDWAWYAGQFAEKAKHLSLKHQWMSAALWYSRAKWCVILGRNNGARMDPRRTGVNLQWLREKVRA